MNGCWACPRSPSRRTPNLSGELTQEQARLVEQEPVARLATIGVEGRPHLVPITFAVVDGLVVTAVDHKPKRTRALQRLANIERDPRVTVLVDHYADDWSELWWVRIDGTAEVVDAGDVFDRAVDALASRDTQYEEHRPDGPAIVIRSSVVTSWSA